MPSYNSTWPRLLLLLGVVMAGYYGVVGLGFVWDDDAFLTGNALIHAGDGLRRFWTTTQAPDYWPVSSSTLWFEWRLWGMHAWGYHLTNACLHGLECVLLWRVLERLEIRGAYVAALLFAAHPVNVESVVWIAQRKNLMAMLFYLLSVYCFARLGWSATRRLDTDGGGSRWSALASTRFSNLWYALSLTCFILGMLSKGSVATLPGVLVLLLWWRRGLTRGRLLRLAPYFAVSAVLVGVNIWFQRHGDAAPIRVAGAGQRLLGAAAAVWFYLGKAVWPVRLAFIYPSWRVDGGRLIWWLPLLGAGALSALLLSWRRRLWGRAALLGWGYFCLTLLPVMGFADVYFMKYSLVADHYQHLALIGVAACAGALWAQAQRRWGSLWPNTAVAAAAALMAVLTHRQSLQYRDSETLFRATLQINPKAWMAQNNLGILLLKQGRTTEAMDCFQRALDAKPDYAEAHIDMGNALLNLGRPGEAAGEYREALACRSAFDREAHLDLGHACFEMGRDADAIAQYRAALRIDPRYAEAHYSLGNAWFAQGRFEDSIAEYRQALSASPDDADAWNNLGSALVRAGRPADALAEYRRALALRPDDSSIESNLAKAREAAGLPAPGQQ